MAELTAVMFGSIKEAQEAARSIGRLPSEYLYYSLGEVVGMRDERHIIVGIKHNRIVTMHEDSEMTVKEKKFFETNKNRRIMVVRIVPRAYKMRELVEKSKRNRAKYLKEKKDMNFVETMAALKEREE